MLFIGWVFRAGIHPAKTEAAVDRRTIDHLNKGKTPSPPPLVCILFSLFSSEHRISKSEACMHRRRKGVGSEKTKQKTKPRRV